MLNALIVDDEEYSRKSLYFLLQEHCQNVQTAGIAKSVAEARALIDEQHFDLAFLDIAMPKESGFDLLPDLQSKNIMVIFTTAYDQYALQALKASAIDYLLKPIDIDELKASVKKAADRVFYLNAARNSSETTDNPGPLVQENTARESKITLSNTYGFTVIDTGDIIYIEADSNYSIFHLKTREKIITAKPLKEFEEVLDNGNFARIHKSVIVNFKYVKGYSHKNGLQVTLNDETILPVSRRRANEFQEKAKTYFKA